MKHSAANGESHTLAALTRSPEYGARLIEILPAIGDAPTTEVAVDLFRQATVQLGADAGVFMSYLRDDATRASYRSLLACDPLWASEYARRNWHDHDPWLRHATHETEPVRSSELQLTSANEEAFVQASAALGFASAVIAPAPTCAGQSRIGVLCLGSHRQGFFEDDGYGKVRVLARSLSMELHRWLLQAIRKELLAKSRLTAADIELLRHEEAGHTSKVIGAALNIEAKTVDCRFQRISAKLDAPDRRTAMRIARLYGLL
ncbi:helix-turn-helix transcriptional regulator [Methylibium petroleiphilum]|uniref:helix-turn-helix transcriptional regulator n=1 Tax=Methylibium petroleiphilum TaxID=105560 RepID=UPI003D29AC96